MALGTLLSEWASVSVLGMVAAFEWALVSAEVIRLLAWALVFDQEMVEVLELVLV